MSTAGDRVAMKELLKGLSDAEVRELCIEALRNWHKSHPNETQVAMHGALGLALPYDFADQLRRRRNDAAHTTPKYDFEDREEAEEFLVSAGRHLPNVWRMAR
jgi:hypothetical protein